MVFFSMQFYIFNFMECLVVMTSCVLTSKTVSHGMRYMDISLSCYGPTGTRELDLAVYRGFNWS